MKFVVFFSNFFKIVQAIPEEPSSYLLVISCQVDSKIWFPLQQKGYQCYSEELILRGALTQQLDLKSLPLFFLYRLTFSETCWN